MNATWTFLKLTGLCVVLNIIRYLVVGFLEQVLIMERLFDAMAASPAVFNSEFRTIDWVTSFGYNYAMWFAFLVVFHIAHPRLRGHIIVRSLKVFGMMLVIFLSISAIYMNHYAHPSDFYVWNMLDGVLVIPLVGVANGLLYPLFFRDKDLTGLP